MKYLVDPQLILDVLEGESECREHATACFEAHRKDELILAPTSYIALSPSFMGIRSMQDRFLDNLGIRVARSAPAKVMDSAYQAWSRYQKENPMVQGGMSVFVVCALSFLLRHYDGSPLQEPPGGA